MSKTTTGPIPKDRASVPVPARRAGTPTTAPAARAPAPTAPRPAAPTPRAAAPAPRPAVKPPVPQAATTTAKRGAPSKADRAARLAALEAELDANEAAEAAAAQDETTPFDDGSGVVEGAEGEVEEQIVADEPDAVEPTEAELVEQEAEAMEAELEVAPTRVTHAQNPSPTRTTQRPPAPRPVQPTTPVEHRAASGNVRQGKELATRHTTNVAVSKQPHTSSSLKGDIIIPRILLMQGSSQMVKDRKAQVGDIVRSSNGERLGGSRGPDEKADPVNIIPLSLSQSWTIMSGDGKTFIGTQPRNEANDSDPWEFEGDDGEMYRRLKTIEAVVMVASDIERLASGGGVPVDEEGIPLDLDSSLVLPHAVSFKSTGLKAGKGISTFFLRVEALMKTHPLTRPFHFMLPLSCTVDSDDENEWYIFDVGPSKRTPGELVQDAKGWFETVTTRNVVAPDELAAEQEADEAVAAPVATKPTATKRKTAF